MLEDTGQTMVRVGRMVDWPTYTASPESEWTTWEVVQVETESTVAEAAEAANQTAATLTATRMRTTKAGRPMEALTAACYP